MSALAKLNIRQMLMIMPTIAETQNAFTQTSHRHRRRFLPSMREVASWFPMDHVLGSFTVGPVMDVGEGMG